MNARSSHRALTVLGLLVWAMSYPMAAGLAAGETSATTTSSTATATPTTVRPPTELTLVTVDLPILFTFHPAMRNFDHRTGKFVSQAPYTPPTGGLKAWNDLTDQRKAIADLEAAMEGQLGKVNAEMAANNRPADPKAEGVASPPSWVEYQKYAEMAQEHRRRLTELTHQILGGFPESLLGGLPEADLRRIAQEIFTAVEEEAKANQAALVLNLPTFDLGGASPSERETAPPPAPALDLLDRWKVRKLKDLEDLVHQASGSSPLPFGKPLPPRDPKAWCGGHFESIKDPAFLRTLVGEYFEARQVFCRPFENLGVRRRVLKGNVTFHEKDVTIEALARIFDLYKTRSLERDTILAFLRRQRGG